MKCNSSSRSKRRCSRTVAADAAAASRLRRPRMCDGGVATWKRSACPSPSARHQCAVARRRERCVWRTALGESVVPELKTSTTSSRSPTTAGGAGSVLVRSIAPAACAPSRSSTPPAPRCSASKSTPGPSAIAKIGPVRRTASSTSSAFQEALRSTDTAPSLLAACTAATNSGRLDVMTATRSPARTPRPARCRAAALLARLSSAKVQRSGPERTAGASGNRAAADSSPPCMRPVAIGNILLRIEIERQQRRNVGLSP